VTALGVLARRTLWSLFETVQAKRQWRRWNFELCKLHDETEPAKYIKINKIMWEWYAIRIVNNGIAKRMFGISPEGKRGNEKPKERWAYCGLECQSSSREELEEPDINREEWKKHLNKRRAHAGTSSQ
jgi:hypothetical protein